MMRYLLIILLILTAFQLFGNPFNDILKREGFIVDVQGDKVIVDIGAGNVRKGEVFEVIEPGDKIVHPWTDEVIGTKYKILGRIIITEVYERFSYGTIVEGKAEKGNRIKVSVEEVCYVGSPEGFFEIGMEIKNIKRGSDCSYIIRELEEGYGLEFSSMPLFYIKRETQPTEKLKAYKREKTYAEEGNAISKISLKAHLIGTFSDIPISADTGDIYGDGKDYLVILFEDRLEIFEIHKNDILKKDSVFLPAGFPAFLKVARVNSEDDRDYILLNMVEGNESKSYIIKVVKDEPVFIIRDIPFFINVLNKRNAAETFVGQKVSFPKWSKPFRVQIEGEEIKEIGVFTEEESFIIDGAFYYKDMLCYIDKEGALHIVKDGLRIFKGSLNLRGSYSYVSFGEDEDDKEVFFFANPMLVIKIYNNDILLTSVNERSKASELFNLPLFKKGYIHFSVLGKEDMVFIKADSEPFKQTVQAILRTKDNQIIVITAFKGTLNFSKGGNIYKISLSASLN